jgi:hypothetical protein
MRKWILIVRHDGPHPPFAARMRARLAELPGASLVVTEAPPPFALFPFQRRPLALFSITADDVSALAASLGAAAYPVDEALPVPRPAHWPSRAPSPILVTLFHRRPGLPWDTFLERWHDGHTPLSLEVHPLVYYVRNVVLEHPEDAEPWDGIVVEACPTRRDLLDPRRFYGGSTRAMLRNLPRIARDITRFLDPRRMEVFYATEYRSG